MTEHQSQNSIKIILKLIYKFSIRERGILKKEYHKNQIIYHYFYEIVRYWNTINYIVKKNLRFIKKVQKIKEEIVPIYFYISYRIIWEHAPVHIILKEIDFFFKNKEIQEKDKIKDFIKALKTFSLLKALKNKKKKDEILSIEYGVPSFFIKILSRYMDMEFIKKNIIFMNDIKNQKYSIWFNLNKIKKEEKYNHQIIINDLKKKGIEILEDKDINYLYHVNNRNEIIDSEYFKKGYVFFQNKASFAVIEILNPSINDFIFDMCAGSGIKTSLITEKLNNKYNLIAAEFDNNRTIEFKKIIINFDKKRFNIINSDSIDPPFRDNIQFDKILLDAPCSGSGTFKANPELKWRQNIGFLNQNITLQEKLIKSALEILKPGGIFVYSTCSLYAEEGELQIKKFLKYLDPLDLPKWISPSYTIDNMRINGTGRLYPANHKTEGFFIAKFKKK
ncbi:MAG: RsmB/NOP family class I SAM-dependent RNA methyltransferase [Candidatus Lokiarchaeota archaeon]|nr:RsmB/NOP family class I SAM-dependent RNA methyltransferase [Candidatus Lokiarchaeota archaeon]